MKIPFKIIYIVQKPTVIKSFFFILHLLLKIVKYWKNNKTHYMKDTKVMMSNKYGFKIPIQLINE